MNPELIAKAQAQIPSVPLLVNVVSKRVRQLVAGMKPYVRPERRDEEKVDIALREVAEGKLRAEIDYSTIAILGRKKR